MKRKELEKKLRKAVAILKEKVLLIPFGLTLKLGSLKLYRDIGKLRNF